MLVGQRAGDSKAKMLSHRCHGRNHQHWLIQWDLGSLPNRVLRTSLVNIVDAEYVCDEKAVKFTPFQDLSQVRPVFQILVPVREIPWMAPQTGRLVTHTIHIK